MLLHKYTEHRLDFWLTSVTLTLVSKNNKGTQVSCSQEFKNYIALFLFHFLSHMRYNLLAKDIWTRANLCPSNVVGSYNTTCEAVSTALLPHSVWGWWRWYLPGTSGPHQTHPLSPTPAPGMTMLQPYTYTYTQTCLTMNSVAHNVFITRWMQFLVNTSISYVMLFAIGLMSKMALKSNGSQQQRNINFLFAICQVHILFYYCWAIFIFYYIINICNIFYYIINIIKTSTLHNIVLKIYHRKSFIHATIIKKWLFYRILSVRVGKHTFNSPYLYKSRGK